MMPVQSDSGLSAWFGIDHMDQNRNFEHGAPAPAADNSDKRIATDFYTFGLDYMVSRKWTIGADLPLIQRRFTTTAAAGANGPAIIETLPLTDLGDAEIQLLYTGFSADMSTGLGFAVKLPTGRDSSPLDRYGNRPYDRDTLPGSGSTDLKLSGYHLGTIAGRLGWFAQAQYRFAVTTRGGYRPGNEADGALGLTYALDAGHGLAVQPSLQLLGSLRGHDTGSAADPLNSGYRRLLIAPGIGARLTRKLSIYGDVEIPIAQFVEAAASPAIEGTTGQLVAPVLFKLQLNYGF